MQMSRREFAALKRQRTVRLTKLATKAFMLHQRGKEGEVYDLICDEFVSLGGVYVKFLQGVLLNTPIMRKWHNPDRLKIFENLDSEPLDVVQVLQAELAPEQLKDIALVQPTPFAAGSFGQVYLGQHANGKRIIIKVLRPMVRELLKHDLRLIGVFSKGFVNREYKNMDIKLDKAIREFRAATMRETDYVTEAHFAHDLFVSYKNHPKLVIPETYLELSTKHVIVQEYVGGMSFVDLVRVRENGIDPKAYVQEQLGSDLDEQLTMLGVEFLVSAFNLPRMQGDPHPGNIRLLADNKVGIIDFGISAAAPEHKAAFFGVLKEWDNIYANNSLDDFADLFEQFMRFFVNDLYRALKKISGFTDRHNTSTEVLLGEGNSHNSGALHDIGKIVQRMFASAIGTADIRTVVEEGQLLKIFSQVVNQGNRLGLVVKFNASELLRASQTYIALVESVDRYKAVIPIVYRDTVVRVSAEHPELVHQGDAAVSMNEALDTIHQWLERVATRDPALFKQLMTRLRLNDARHEQGPAVTLTEKPTDA